MRWLLRLVFGLVVLAALAGLLFILIPTETIARIAAERFSASTGRELAIRGEVSATLWPVIGISAEDVSLGNPDWAEGDNLMTASRVYVGVDPMTVFSDNVEIRSVELVEPVIALEQAADGRVNWSFGEGSAEAGRSVSIDSIRLMGADISLARAGAAPVQISDGDATLDLVGGGMSARIDATYQGQRIGGTVVLPDLSAMGAGAAQVIADLSVGSSKMQYDGSVDVSASSASGNLRLDILDRAAVFGLLGMAPPDLPVGLGRNRIGVIAGLAIDGNRFDLADLQLNLDQNYFTGAAAIVLGERPTISADLTAAMFEMASTGGGGSSGAGWSNAPLPTAALRSFDADISLAVGSAIIGGMQFGKSQFDILLRNGEMTADFPALGLFDGQASGTAQAKFANGVAFQADLSGSEISTARALTQFAGTDRLASRASGTMSLAGRGNSVAAIMASLSGRGSFDLSEGELRGVDLPGLINSLNPTFNGGASRTVFDSASASFTITDGVLQNPDLSVIAPLLLGAGEGTVGIGPRTLDYTLVVRIPESFVAKEVALPIRITGTWADPQINLNLENVLESRLGVDLEAIGQDATEDIRERLADEFGIEIEPGQDIREALTESLEKRAIDELTGGLLGGGTKTPVVDDPAPVVREEAAQQDEPSPEPEPVSEEQSTATGGAAPKSSLVPKPRPGSGDGDHAAPEPVAAEDPEEPVQTAPDPAPESAAEEPPPEAAPQESAVEPAPEGGEVQVVEEPEPQPDASQVQVEVAPVAEDVSETEPVPAEEAVPAAEPVTDALEPCPENPGADALPCMLEDGTVLAAE